MYIVDGIAYAGERKKLVSIMSVRPLDGYKCQVYFNDGRSGTFDMADVLDKPAFAPLKDKALFDRVYLDFGAPTWCDGDIDIAPEYVYEHTDFSEAEKGA